MQISKLIPDAKLQKDGTWIPYDEEVSFLLAYYGSETYKAKLRKLAVQLRRRNHKRILPPELQRQVEVEAMVGTLLLDWKGLADGHDESGKDKPLPFSEDAAKKLLTQSQELYDFIATEVSLLENFQPGGTDEDETGGSSEEEGASAELKSGPTVVAQVG